MRTHRDTQIALFGLSDRELQKQKQRKEREVARKQAPSKIAKTSRKRKAAAASRRTATSRRPARGTS